MRYEDVTNLVKSFGLPFAYYAFPEGTAQVGPYVIFWFPDRDDLFADNINYQDIAELRIELYTRNKDFALEREIEQKLTQGGIAYYKDETYIEGEHQFMILYQTEVVING